MIHYFPLHRQSNVPLSAGAFSDPLSMGTSSSKDDAPDPPSVSSTGHVSRSAAAVFNEPIVGTSPAGRRCEVCLIESCPLGGARTDLQLLSLGPHSLCRGCLGGHVESVDASAIGQNSMLVPCPSPSCRCGGWPLEALASVLSPAALQALALKFRRLAQTAENKRAVEQEVRDLLDRGLGTSTGASAAGIAPISSRAPLLAEVVRHRDLTLRCPRCALPFEQIVGCNAVTCQAASAAAASVVGQRYGCGATFCGVCTREFATSAETHGHQVSVHGSLFDKSQLLLAQALQRATAVEASLRAFGAGVGGAQLQRAVVEALGDEALRSAGFSMATMLARLGLTAHAHASYAVAAMGGAGAAVGGAGAGTAARAAADARAASASGVAVAASSAAAAVAEYPMQPVAAPAPGWVSLKLAALSTAGDDAAAAHRTCDDIISMSQTHDMRVLLAGESAALPLSAALQQHARNAGVVVAACGALVNVAIGAAEASMRLPGLGTAVAAVLKALCVHMSSAATVQPTAELCQT